MKPRSTPSRYGCKTCKARRVKCDETLPHCRRCVDTGRKCDGPSTEKIIIRHYRGGSLLSNTGGSLLTSTGLPRIPFGDPLEARTFDFFLTRAAPSLAGCLDEDLWRILLPQVSHSNKAIRHAVLAISTLYEHPLLDAYHTTGIRYSPHQRKAMEWYRVSVANALIPDTTLSEREQLESSLLTCLLFISIEIQHAMVHNTLGLLKQGWKLLDRYLDLQMSHHDARARWIEELVCPFLVRQAVLFTIFGHVLPPDIYPVICRTLPPNIWPITSLADARTVIYALLLRTFDLVQTATLSDLTNATVRARIIHRQSDLLGQLQRWQAEADHLTNSCSLSQAERALYHTLVCNQKVSSIWLGRLLETPLVEAAAELGAFSDIITHAEVAISCLDRVSGNAKSIPFMFELGVIPPLFFVGWQCRSDVICRQAVALMKRAPAQESLFVAELQINALEKIIAIEEGLIGRVEECEAAEQARLPDFYQARPLRQVVGKYTLSVSPSPP